MKVKIKINNSTEEKEITPIYFCKHIENTNKNSNLQEIKFDETTEFILIENNESLYGFSVLELKDTENKIYEYNDFKDSKVCSVIISLLNDVIKLKTDNMSMMESVMNTRQVIRKLIGELETENNEHE